MGIFIKKESVLKDIWIIGSTINLFIGTAYMSTISRVNLTEKGKKVYNSYSRLKQKLKSLDNLDQRTYEIFLPYAYIFSILYEWTKKAKRLGPHNSYWHDEESPKQILNIIEEIYNKLDVKYIKKQET